MILRGLAALLARSLRLLSEYKWWLGFMLVFIGPPVMADQIRVAYSGQPVVILNDSGGDVGARGNKIRAMRAAGQIVQIRGAICYSACTMYLGLPGSCVSRKTQFGFHRPSFFGAALPPAKFEFWSQVIAAHYPTPLHNWYLQVGRYSNVPIVISGREIIRLGIAECG